MRQRPCTFGLIWLTHLRAREKRVTVAGLAIYVPAGRERAIAPRLLCLDPAAARFELFTYTQEDYVMQADPRDCGNLDTRLEPWRRRLQAGAWEGIAGMPGVERIPKHGGSESWRVRGVEFAELSESGLRFGLGERRPAAAHHTAEIARLVEELERVRRPGADREHPLVPGGAGGLAGIAGARGNRNAGRLAAGASRFTARRR